MSSSTAAEATALPPPGKDLASDARVVSELKSLPSETSRAPWRKLSMREVSSHRTLRDGWIAVNGRVYDISAFATTHPGFNNAGQVSTALAIARMLGKDATAEFEEIHSDKAWRQLRDFQVGVLARDDASDDVDANRLRRTDAGKRGDVVPATAAETTSGEARAVPNMSEARAG